MAGAGIRGGQVIGSTDEFGYKALEQPISTHDLHATMLHLLGMDHTQLTYRFSGRDMRLTEPARPSGFPIPCRDSSYATATSHACRCPGRAGTIARGSECTSGQLLVSWHVAISAVLFLPGSGNSLWTR